MVSILHVLSTVCEVSRRDGRVCEAEHHGILLIDDDGLCIVKTAGILLISIVCVYCSCMNRKAMPFCLIC